MFAHGRLCGAVCVGLLSLLGMKEASSASPVPRTIGSTAVNPGDYSYFVSVNGCGGTLIAPEWVLTAQHCLDSAPVGSTVQPGWTRNDTSVGKVTTRVVAHERPPQNWDIALLKVEPVTSIRPLPLAAVTPTVPQLMRGVAGGYGSPGGLGTALFYLVATDGHGWSVKGATEDIRLCSGDSGSPYIIDTAAGPRLIGVHFAGTNCNPDATSYGVNVTYPPVQSWIAATTGVNPGPVATLVGFSDGQAYNAGLAGDNNWKTYWTAPGAVPVSVRIDQAESQAAVPVNTLTYLPREDARSGDVNSYRITVSVDGGDNFQVAYGTWPSSKDPKTVTWPAVDNSRYVSLEIFATNGGPANVAELSTSWTTPPYPILSGRIAVAASSWQDSNPPELATNGSPTTFWHSRYSQPLPQSITIQAAHPTANLTYLPRQDGGTNGIITTYNVYGSNDGVTWSSVQGGTWSLDSSRKTTNPFTLAGQNYPYYRLVATAGGGGFAAAADLDAPRPQKRTEGNEFSDPD